MASLAASISGASWTTGICVIPSAVSSIESHPESFSQPSIRDVFAAMRSLSCRIDAIAAVTTPGYSKQSDDFGDLRGAGMLECQQRACCVVTYHSAGYINESQHSSEIDSHVDVPQRLPVADLANCASFT